MDDSVRQSHKQWGTGGAGGFEHGREVGRRVLKTGEKASRREDHMYDSYVTPRPAMISIIERYKWSSTISPTTDTEEPGSPPTVAMDTQDGDLSIPSDLLCLVRENCDRWKHAPAVKYDDGNIVTMVTYKQMFDTSSCISSVLAKYGVKDEVVGILHAANQHLPSILCGILECNAAFYSFEPTTISVEYTTNVIERLGIRFIITESEKLQKIERLICRFDGEMRTDPALVSLDIIIIHLKHIKAQHQSTSFAYCITTSGTTGSPKIVKVPHTCIIPNIVHLRSLYQMKQGDVVFLSSPLTFDPSLVEVFVTLSSGACLLIVPHYMKMMPHKLLSMLYYRHQVTVLQATPSLVTRMDNETLSTSLLGPASNLRILALGGEKFPPLSVVKKWRSCQNRTRFINLYGITEVSCWAMYYEVTEADFRNESADVPLGQPLQRTSLVVLDRHGKEVLEGEGHAYIESQDRICCIDNENWKMLKGKVRRDTGDIVKIKADKNVIFVCRKDKQIKRNGQRINLVEIEQVVAKSSAVKDCKVLYEKGRLLVFVNQSENTSSCTVTDVIATRIRKSLPSHYWPDDIIKIQEVPVTRHGKTDYNALLRLGERSTAKKYSTLVREGKTYELLLQVWKDVLEIDLVMESDNFVMSGGDSLSAVLVNDKLEAALDSRLPRLLELVLNNSFGDIFSYIEKEVGCKKSEIGSKSTFNHREMQLNLVDENGKNEGKDAPSVKSSVYDVLSDNNTPVPDKKRKINSDVAVDKKSSPPCQGSSRQGSKHTEDQDFSLNGSFGLYSLSRCNKYFSCVGDFEQVGDIYHMGKDRSFDESICVNKHTFGNATEEGYSIEYSGRHNLNQSVEVQRKISEGGGQSEEVRGHKSKVKCIQVWKHDTGKCVDASPLVVINRNGQHVIYIGSHSHKFCAIAMETGQLLWKVSLGDRIESSACVSLCGKFIIVGCYDGGVYVLSISSGQILWVYRTHGEVKSSPVVDPVTSLVIVGSHDQNLFALSIERRDCVWRRHLDGGSIFSSPTINTDPHMLVACTLTGRIVAMQPRTGDILWKYDCGKPVFSSPNFTKLGPCVGCVDGKLYQLDFQGRVVWTLQTEAPIFCSPTYIPVVLQKKMNCKSISDYRIIVGSHDQYVYCVLRDGNLSWKSRTDSTVFSSGFGFGISDHFLNDVNAHAPSSVSTVIPESVDTSVDQTESDGVNNNNLKFEQHQDNPDQKYIKLNSNSKIETRLANSLNQLHGNNLEHYSKVKCSEYVVYASSKGTLYILDVITGDLLTSVCLPGEIFSSPVVINDHVVLGCRDNFVYCFKINMQLW